LNFGRLCSAGSAATRGEAGRNTDWEAQGESYTDFGRAISSLFARPRLALKGRRASEQGSQAASQPGSQPASSAADGWRLKLSPSWKVAGDFGADKLAAWFRGAELSAR